MKERNSNLRKLAAAYAQGKIDQKLYRKLRMGQLSALDFNKPVPDVPNDIAKIHIPKQGEMPGALPQKGNGTNYILIAAIIVALGATAYILFV